MTPSRRARRRTTAPAVRAAVVLAATLAAVSLPGLWAPAAAHTEVLRASPAPGEEVTGPVDSIELVFLDPVQPGVTIDVTDDLGDPVTGAGEVEMSDDRRTATQALPDLEGAGDYVVEYTFTAPDGDTQRQTHRFTIVASDGDAISAGTVVGLVAAAAALAGGIVLALVRRRRSG